MTEAREKEIYKVTLIGTAVNAFLIIIKLLAGIFGRSSALFADAIHSLTDFVSDIIVLVFVRISGKPCDREHRYGHGKYETLATLIIGVILLAAGIGLLVKGVSTVISCIGGYVPVRPEMSAFIVAILSIVLKEWLYRYTVVCGRRLNSSAVIANAWHHRSDAISSIGTLVGVAGSMFLGEKWRVLDPLAAVVVSFFIIQAGWGIVKTNIGELTEEALPDAEEQEISSIVSSVEGVRRIHNLRTRRIGSRIAIDLHAKMDGNITLYHAHNIATEIEQSLRRRFGEDTFVNVHMEPAEKQS